MKRFLHTLAITTLLIVCCTSTAHGGNMEAPAMADNIDGDYTANAAVIEQKKQEMLAISDDIGYFWFSDDTEFQEQDPNAYWLMNRMMMMMQHIVTADDCWAWMLAMNDSIEEYNKRLGRKIGSHDAACNAIKELIGIYNAGNQPMLNTASYVESILMHYRAVYAYYSFIEYIDDYDEDTDWDVQLRALYYREFKEWFDLNNAANGLMTFYTYASAGYSALPMSINGTIEVWSRERLAELKIERSIYQPYDWKPFESDAKIITVKRYNKQLHYFKTRTKSDVIEEFLGILYKVDDEDYEYAESRVGSQYDFDKIAEMLCYYETALANWRDVREQIAHMLPKEKQKSYREITQQMHTRLYNDLIDLKTIRF